MKDYILLSAVLFLAACNTTKEPVENDTDSSQVVEVQTLTPQHLSDDIILSGSIEGSTTVKLGFMVPGKIEYISAKEGEYVSKGQLLSQLEPTSYSLAKQLSDVQLNAAKDEYKRLELMHSKGSVSESDFSKVTFSLQQAEIQQKQQAKNVADTRLYSPLTGVLLSKQTNVGEVIGVGTPLFVVADIKKVIVSSFIPEGELQQVTIGQPVKISISALNKNFTGKVTEVGAMADAASRAFTVKMEVENRDLQIRPGMIAEASITDKINKVGILVPGDCIVHDQDDQCYIYVVDKSQHKAFRRRISLGGVTDNKVQIVSGLSAGETIVTSGQSKLSDGVNITIVK
jgi:membrane fusion protein, multidrug efflux system